VTGFSLATRCGCRNLAHTCGSPYLIACTPPGYHSIERARLQSTAENWTGEPTLLVILDCLFYHHSVHVKQLTLGDYVSFEHTGAYVTGSTLTTLMIVIYRPGFKAITDVCFDELTYAASLEILINGESVKFNELLESLGFVQRCWCNT